ncbi:hypothetical protein [Alienimonas chondri]|uniref:Uncharacterized protein n=1 Tax=Alienimonas chondri TaxID=2681879 RepID=A0ABX1VF40_9PLAN|nr:hypothetical protein [Alienimonas chondri]NNJ25883.1 hypothetical protein [Alienimonas chondri]
MGVFVSVCGWIETNSEQVPLVRRVIEDDVDGVGSNNASWHIPETGGGYSRFLFFGCTVRAYCVDDLRNQVRRITESVKTYDGEYTDFPQGEFVLEHEGHETEPERYPLVRWRFSHGAFVESESA